MSQATDWNPSYSHPDGAPPASDADPNVTDPIPLGKTFNTGLGGQSSSQGAAELMLLLDGVTGNDVTITTYVQVDAPAAVSGAANGWVPIRTGDTVAYGTALYVPVPLNARIHCRITARTGTPTALYAGLRAV